MVFRAHVLRMAERQRGFRDGVNGSIGRRSPWRNPKLCTPYQKIVRTSNQPHTNLTPTSAERSENEPFAPRPSLSRKLNRELSR